MDEAPKFYYRPEFWRKLVFVGFLLLFLIFFWNEFLWTVSGVLVYLAAVKSCADGWLSLPQCAQVLAQVNLDAHVLRAMDIILANIVVYFTVTIFSALQTAQFTLPVHTLSDRWKAFKRIILFLVGGHGPAIFIKEGQNNAREEETKNYKPGVALVDLSSSIVLEQQKNTSAWKIQRWRAKQVEDENESTQRTSLFLKKLLRKLNGETPPYVRVVGPGVVFTQRGEKVHSVVDLRKQIRVKPDVQAFTGDGIELKVPVITIFSLSESPEVIPVAYIGGKEVENLYGLKLDEKKEAKTIKVTGFFELDHEDAIEMHNYFEFGRVPLGEISNQPAPVAHQVKTPYPFDEQRVFEAAYSQALIADAEPTPWHELPLRVAIDIFRNEMERYNFDDLTRVDQPGVFPLLDIKDRFSRRVRFQGLLAYKLVQLKIGTPSTWQAASVKPADLVGKTWKTAELSISAVRKLYASKVLRDRGIRVIAATFPEFRVADESMNQNMVAGWKSRWEWNLELATSWQELEADSERIHAQAQAQGEMTSKLANLFKNENSARSKEALALRILYSLEKAAQNKVEPREVFDMLQNLHRWLLLESKDGKPKSGRPGGSGEHPLHPASPPPLEDLPK